MGQISFTSPPVTLTAVPLATWVMRYDGESSYRLLPNVLCLSIRQSEGAVPSEAMFRYILDDSMPNSPFPSQFEDLFPLTATGSFLVGQDDRLVVFGQDSDGDQRIIFDGFAQMPSLTLGPRSQLVGFSAYGVEVRLWDTPAEGACYRDADDTTDGDPIVTSLPVRFNPTDNDQRLQPNSTLPGNDAIAPDDDAFSTPGKYPLFLDPNIQRDPTPLAPWTLGSAIRYLLWRNNPDETYVSNGDTTKLDSLFQAVSYQDGSDDPDGDAGVQLTDIVIRDYDASNRPFIESIQDLCESYGFALRFAIETETGNTPLTTIRFYRKDGQFSGKQPKVVYLDDLDRTAILDPSKFNVSGMSLARDAGKINNSFAIETAPVRYELSVILAPLFSVAKGDASDTQRTRYIEGNWTELTPQATRDRYRLYGMDECGDGHWDTPSYTFVMTAGDLGPVLNVNGDGSKPAMGTRNYAKRYRPALTNLLQRDPAAPPIKATLSISRNYMGKVACVWDGSGTWQPISSNWVLVRDRLGIRITAENPEKWAIGDYKGANPQNGGPAVSAITAVAAPTTDTPSMLITGKFFLRLTCVIEGDIGISALVDRRSLSPTSFTIARRIDARDNFLREVVDPSSACPLGGGTVRDDTKDAVAYADQYRAAHETAPASGSITIPRFTDSYSVGDRISQIAGRDCNLQSSAGSQEGMTPQYPMVSRIEWNFDGNQGTMLTLTDHARTISPL